MRCLRRDDQEYESASCSEAASEFYQQKPNVGLRKGHRVKEELVFGLPPSLFPCLFTLLMQLLENFNTYVLLLVSY